MLLDRRGLHDLLARVRLQRRLTISGSRWSKNAEAPVSRPAMRSICSAVSSRSNTSKFSAIRSRRTDLGMTTTTSLDAAGVHQLLVGVALEERVGLDLVHRRSDLVVLDEVDKPFGIEVREAHSPDQALPV